MDAELVAKLVGMVGLPIVILIVIGFAAWRFSGWAGKHVDSLIVKFMQLVDVLIDFFQSTKARLAALEDGQAALTRRMELIHENQMNGLSPSASWIARQETKARG